jgi:hypothetical protein
MSYYDLIGGKPIFFTVILCIMIFTISMLALSGSSREGFNPKWIRTNKNNTLRKFRRTIKPYSDMFFSKIHRFRRKWL